MQAMELKQLFSVPEKCLPNGRQALEAGFDFSVQPSYTFGVQSLAGTRNFAGIKSIFLDANPGPNLYGIPTSQYSITNATPLGTPRGMFYLRNSATNSKYYLTQTNWQLYGVGSASANMAYPTLPTGYSWAFGPGGTIGPQSHYACMAPDGSILALATDISLTTNSLMVYKTDAQTGALVSSVTIPNATNTLDITHMALVCGSDGTLWVAYTNTGATNTTYVTSIDTTTMAVIGTFTGPVSTLSTADIIFPQIVLTTTGLVVVFIATGSVTAGIGSFAISSLAGGVYTGEISYQNQGANLFLSSITMMSNAVGGVLIIFNDGAQTGVWRLDGNNFLFNPASSNYGYTIIDSPETFPLVLPYTNNPAAGQKYFYIWNTNSTDSTTFTITAYDTYTLLPVKTFTLPFGTLQTLTGIGTSELMIDTDTGDVYFCNYQNSQYVFEYGQPSGYNLTVKVNGTGQKLNFNVVNNLIAWLPLMCLDNDTITISAPNGYVKCYLLNYDVVPYLIST